MRTICVVQSRLSSKRFPSKALADLNGHPMIWHVVERAKDIAGVEVVLAVPVADATVFRATVSEVEIYADRGDETDVLGRFVAVARAHDAEEIVRVTGDCPVLNPAVANQVLTLFWDSQPCHFASNDTLVSGWPDGFDVAVIDRAALETAAAQATDPQDREHLECWFKRPENGMRCVTLYNPEPWTGPTKLSVDVPSDLETVRQWLTAQHG